MSEEFFLWRAERATSQRFATIRRMAEIKPIPTKEADIPRISKLKIAALIVVILGTLALGVTIQMRNQNKQENVLGEETTDIKDVVYDEFGKALGDKADLLDKGKNPEKLLEESQQIIASKSAEFGNIANMEVEKIASQAAHNVTNFIYRNTIERLIDTLIYSLPEERQKEYK